MRSASISSWAARPSTPYTDRNGGYRFVVGKNQVGSALKTGTLTVKGKKQTVKLFGNEPTVIRTQ